MRLSYPSSFAYLCLLSASLVKAETYYSNSTFNALSSSSSSETFIITEDITSQVITSEYTLSSSNEVQYIESSQSILPTTELEPVISTSSVESTTESITESTAESITESITESTTGSASESESALPTPVIDGEISNGLPQWTIQVPGSLGPWTELSLALSKEGPFVYTNADVSIDQEVDSSAIITVFDDSITVILTKSVSTDSIVYISFAGVFTSAGTAVVSGVVSITTLEARLLKRAVTTYDVEFTIESNDETSFSESSSASSLPSSTSESVTSTSSSQVTSTVTSMTQDSTTVFTTTSCSNSVCSDVLVTTGVTVITTTVDGSVSEYTTFIPLPTSAAPETTVVTITSCEEDKCSEAAVTTGVTVITKTVDGIVTAYTTYCPLSTTTLTTASTTAAPETTVITVTSCAENKCTKKEVTTGVTVVTSTVHGTVTEYTTYCLLPTSKPSTTVITTTSCKDNKCSEAAVTTGVIVYTSTFEGSVTQYTTYLPFAEETTIITITSDEYVTLYESSSSVEPTTTIKSTSVITVSSFEGAGHRLAAGSSLVAFIFGLMLF